MAIKTAFFLEDRGHEQFMKSLVSRIADEEDACLDMLVLNAAGGAPRLDEEFESFLRDYSSEGGIMFDLVVVAKDTDCRGVQTVANELQHRVGRASYPGRTVFAAPEPHIECWYLADPNAIQRVLQSPTLSAVPDSRCGRGRFKRQLIQVFVDAGVQPQSGGIEYAEPIVREMDIYRASTNVPSLKRFIDDLRSALRELSAE